MKTPDSKVLQALINLESTCPDEYAIIQEWFLESAAREDETLRSSETALLIHRAQGASRVMLKVLEYMAESRQLLKRMTNKPAARPGGFC